VAQVSSFAQGADGGQPGPGQAMFHIGGLEAALPLPLPGVGGGKSVQAVAVLDMGTLQTLLSKLTIESSLLLEAKREHDIDVQVAFYSTLTQTLVREPWSTTCVCRTDLVDSVAFGG
jgi:hypothetical protein